MAEILSIAVYNKHEVHGLARLLEVQNIRTANRDYSVISVNHKKPNFLDTEDKL